MPTPKQVRFHYGRIQKLREKLERALSAAHRAKVLVYTDYDSESPCSSLWDVDVRIDKTTEKALAQAMREEILKY